MAHKNLTPNGLVTVAETAPFIRQPANPGVGDVIQDTGGLRKIRWSRPGTGKLDLGRKTTAPALTETIKQTYRRHEYHDQIWRRSGRKPE